jgi:Tfp pilus assembly protein PilV
MIKRAFPAGDDRGETLVETLISIVLLGILGLAVLDGMIVLSKSAALYDRQASAFKNQRGWAEVLSGASFNDCSHVPPMPSSATDVGTMTACSAAPGVLRLTITVTSTGGNKTFTTTPLDVVVMTP